MRRTEEMSFDRDVDERGIGKVDGFCIRRAAEKRAQQHHARPRAVRPLRRDPRARADTQLAVLAGDDEAAAGEGMIDACARPRERHAHSRDVRDFGAERRERRVGSGEQSCRRMRRRGKDDRARANAPAVVATCHTGAANETACAPVRTRTLPAGSRLSIAETSSPMPPRSALKSPSPAPGRAAGASKRRPSAAAATSRGATVVDREFLDVTGMDAAEQRLRDEADGCGTEVPAVETRHRLVFRCCSGLRRRRARVHRPRQMIAGLGRQQAVLRGAGSRGRNTEDRRRRQRVQPAVRMDERRARGSRRHQPRAEAELLAEANRRGFGREHRVGAGVDGEALDVIRAHEPAGALGRLEQDERHAARRELVRRREARDAAADDDDHGKSEC